MKKILLAIILVLTNFCSLFAQIPVDRNEFYENWKVGVIGGASYLAVELNKDFSGGSTDMNSLASGSYGLLLSKRFSRRFEIGAEYSQTYFRGYKKNSSNVLWLMYGTEYNNSVSDFQPFSIYYKTNIKTLAFDLKVNFINFYSIKHNYLNTNMFFRADIGVSFIGVELGYENEEDYVTTNLKSPLFEKGQGSHPEVDSYTSYSAGIGFNHNLSPRMSLTFEASGLLVNADYLDGVHNFRIVSTTDNVVQLERVGVYDIVGMFQVSVSYQFDIPILKKKDSADDPWEVGKKGFVNEFYIDKKNNRFKDDNLPFSR